MIIHETQNSLKKNKRSCSIMYQIMIIYDTEEVLRENVPP